MRIEAWPDRGSGRFVVQQLCAGEVLHGEPADVITEYTEANDVDLIVLGARGRSAVGKFLLGSVRGSVMRSSEPIRSGEWF